MKSAEEYSTDDLLQLTSEGAVALSLENIDEAQTVIPELPVGDIIDIPEDSSSIERPLTSPYLTCPPEDSPCIPSPLSSPPLSVSPIESPPLVINNEGKVLLPMFRKKDISPNPIRGKTHSGTCSECGKYFRKALNLKQHMGIHFADKQLYQCHICSHSFAWKSSLNKHLAKHFPELAASHKTVCPDCGIEYATPAQVHEHIRRDHLLERSHACHLCSKAFYKKHDLATHMRVHTKEKPYMCGNCGQTFTHISHVKRHELIHQGVKSFECDTCQARFRQSSGLKAHVRRHHTSSGSSDIIEELYAIVDDVSES